MKSQFKNSFRYLCIILKLFYWPQSLGVTNMHNKWGRGQILTHVLGCDSLFWIKQCCCFVITAVALPDSSNSLKAAQVKLGVRKIFSLTLEYPIILDSPRAKNPIFHLEHTFAAYWKTCFSWKPFLCSPSTLYQFVFNTAKQRAGGSPKKSVITQTIWWN